MTNLTGEQKITFRSTRGWRPQLKPGALATPMGSHKAFDELPLGTGLNSRTRKPLAGKREDGKGFGAGNGDGKAQQKSPGPHVRGSQSEENRSEHEGIICKVLRGQLLCTRHDLEWINLNRRGGSTGVRVRDCPSCDASQDQSGGTGCEQSGLAHLNPPVDSDLLCACEVAHKEGCAL